MHLRLIVPAALTDEVERMLQDSGETKNLVVVPGAARQPVGDLVTVDVTREATGGIVDELKRLGLGEQGAIGIDHVAATVDADSAGRRGMETAGVGGSSDAIVWEEVEARSQEEVDLSATFLAFMSVAVMIAGLGVLLDQPILVVGAMVVGPDFGPLAALAVGLVRRRWRVARRALVTIGVGFAAGIVAAIALTALLTWFGILDHTMLERDRPLTEFIYRPDALSWVVGLLAGVAGILALTSTKSGALIGVLISVTTIPAAGNLAVAVTYGVWPEAAGSLLQLSVNLVAITVGAVLTLFVQRAHQRRLDRRVERIRTR